MPPLLPSLAILEVEYQWLAVCLAVLGNSARLLVFLES